MQVPWTYRGAAIAVAAFLLVTGLASSASASTLYAEPRGDGPLPCAAANPCSLARAVAGATNINDEVVLAYGTYSVGTGGIRPSAPRVTIRGARASDPVPSGNSGGERRPLVIGKGRVVLSAPDANVRWLGLYSETTEIGGTVVEAKHLEDVWAYSLNENGCSVWSATNTLCRGGKVGLYWSLSAPRTLGDITLNLTNVTAIGGTYAVDYASGGSLNTIVQINSSLLSGDVRFQSRDAATIRGVLTYSRVSGVVITQGMGASWQSGVGTATGPANFPALQSPSFVPADGSSAVDAGDPELSRTTDLGYNTGVVNDRIDIGAYENQSAIGGPPPADPAQELPPGAVIPPIVGPTNPPAATPAPVTARASVRVGRPRAKVQRRSMTTRVRVVTNKPGRIAQTVRYRQGKRNRVACRATIVASDAVTRNVSCTLNRRARALLRKQRVRFTVTTVFRAAGEAPVRSVKRFSVKRRA